ncbi:MAG: hypothetical protein J6C34_03960 [Oscillospiraceae bacterium]|nr:hypothetical protein [Oscillospiraceae bacterium]
MERKAGENTEKYSIFDFENPLKSRISGGRNDQAAVKFRVLHLRPLGQLSVYKDFTNLSSFSQEDFWKEEPERRKNTAVFSFLENFIKKPNLLDEITR